MPLLRPDSSAAPAAPASTWRACSSAPIAGRRNGSRVPCARMLGDIDIERRSCKERGADRGDELERPKHRPRPLSTLTLWKRTFILRQVIKNVIPRRLRPDERVVLGPDGRIAIHRSQPDRHLGTVRPGSAEQTRAANRAERLDRAIVGT